MNAKHVVQVFKSAFIHKSPKTPLGRWTIHDNLLHTKLKINYANEDHCGTCAEYIIQKQHIQKDKLQEQKINDEYIFMMGIESTPDLPRDIT